MASYKDVLKKYGIKSGGVSTSSSSSSTTKSPQTKVQSVLSKYGVNTQPSQSKTPVAKTDSQIKSYENMYSKNNLTNNNTRWLPTDESKIKKTVRYGETAKPKKGVIGAVKDFGSRALGSLNAGVASLAQGTKVLVQDKDKRKDSVGGAFTKGLTAGARGDAEYNEGFGAPIAALVESKNKTKRTVGGVLAGVQSEKEIARAKKVAEISKSNPLYNLIKKIAPGFVEKAEKQQAEQFERGSKISREKLIAGDPTAIKNASEQAHKVGIAYDFTLDPLNYITGGLGATRTLVKGTKAAEAAEFVKNLEKTQDGAKILQRLGMEGSEAEVKSLVRKSTKALGGKETKPVKFAGLTVAKPETINKAADTIHKAINIVATAPAKGVKKGVSKIAQIEATNGVKGAVKKAVVNTYSSAMRGADAISESNKATKTALREKFIGGRDSDLIAMARNNPEEVLNHMALAMKRNDLNITKVLENVKAATIHNRIVKEYTEDESKGIVRAEEADPYAEMVTHNVERTELHPSYEQAITQFQNDMKKEYMKEYYKLKDIQSKENRLKSLEDINAQEFEIQMLQNKLKQIQNLYEHPKLGEYAQYYTGEKNLNVNDFISKNFDSMTDDEFEAMLEAQKAKRHSTPELSPEQKKAQYDAAQQNTAKLKEQQIETGLSTPQKTGKFADAEAQMKAMEESSKPQKAEFEYPKETTPISKAIEEPKTPIGKAISDASELEISEKTKNIVNKGSKNPSKMQKIDREIRQMESSVGVKESEKIDLRDMSPQDKNRYKIELNNRSRKLNASPEDTEAALKKHENVKPSEPIDDAITETKYDNSLTSGRSKPSKNPKDDAELYNDPNEVESFLKQHQYISTVSPEHAKLIDTDVVERLKNRGDVTNREAKEVRKALYEIQNSEEFAKAKEAFKTDKSNKHWQDMNRIKDNINSMYDAKDVVKNKEWFQSLAKAKTREEIDGLLARAPQTSSGVKPNLEVVSDVKVAQKSSESSTDILQEAAITTSKETPAPKNVIDESEHIDSPEKYKDNVETSEDINKLLDDLHNGNFKDVPKKDAETIVKNIPNETVKASEDAKYVWNGKKTDIQSVEFNVNGTKITVHTDASKELIDAVFTAVKNAPKQLKPFLRDLKIINGKLQVNDATINALTNLKDKSIVFTSNELTTAADKLASLGQTLAHEVGHATTTTKFRSEIIKLAQDAFKGLSKKKMDEIAGALKANPNSFFGKTKKSAIENMMSGHISGYSKNLEASGVAKESVNNEYTSELFSALYGEDKNLSSVIRKNVPDVAAKFDEYLANASKRAPKDMLAGTNIPNKERIIKEIEGRQEIIKGLKKDLDGTGEQQNLVDSLQRITTKNATDNIVQEAFDALHPELVDTKHRTFIEEITEQIVKHPADDLPAHQKEIRDIVRAEFKRFGIEEGLAEQMLDFYMPHIINPLYTKDKRKVQNLFSLAEFDTPYNKFGEHRTGIPIYSENGELLDIADTIEKINKHMRDAEGLPNYLLDKLEQVYLSRALYHNQFMWEKGMAESYMNSFGKQIHTGKSIGNMTPEQMVKFAEENGLPKVGDQIPGRRPGTTYSAENISRMYYDKFIKERIKSGKYMPVNVGDKFKAADDLVGVTKDEINRAHDRTNQMKVDAWRYRNENPGNEQLNTLTDNILANPFIEFDRSKLGTYELYMKNEENIFLMPTDVYNNYQKVMKNQFRQQTGLIAKYTDPITKLFKYTATVANPTFHVSNIYGNLLNSYLGVGSKIFDPENHIDAINVVRAAKHPKAASKMILDKTAKEWNDLLIREGVFGGEFFSKEIQNTIKSSKDVFHDVRSAQTPLGKLRGVLEKPQHIAASIEEQNKAMNFFAHIRNGKDVKEAAELTNKFTFDYGDLTQFENDKMKRIFPFYTWMRKNIPLQLEQMIEQPVKYNRMNRTMQAASQDETEYESRMKPEYLNRALKVGDGTYLSINAPMFDIDKLSSPKDFFSSLNPLAKLAYELPANKNMYFDSEIKRYKDEMTEAPAYLKWLPNFESESLGNWVQTGKDGKKYIDPRILYLTKSLMPALSNYSNVANFLTGSGKPSDQLKGGGYMFGTRLYRPNLEQAEENQNYDYLENLKSEIANKKKQGYIKEEEEKYTKSSTSTTAAKKLLKKYGLSK